MQIQTFTGPTLVEALSQVKLELGDEAIILTSRRAEDPSRLPAGHVVEVVAALPHPPQRRGARPATRTGVPRAWNPPRVTREGQPLAADEEQGPALAPRAEPAPQAPPEAPSSGRSASSDELGELRRELVELRRSLKDHSLASRYGQHRAWSPEHEQALRTLCGRGLSRPVACAVLDELPESGGDRLEAALLAALARRLPCAGEDEPGGPWIEALVGPTGVGKTTALAKLLLHRGLGHSRAGILSLDTKRVAAVEQIRRLASILHAPLETVYRPGELGAALERLSGCDLILVDTPGTGPRERLGLERVRAFLKELKPRHVHVVVPASMKLEDQLASLLPWKSAGADRLLATKLDEATGLGGLVDLAEQAGLPFSWVATGPRIPDDLLRPTGRQLAGWLLKPESLGREEETERSAGLRRLQALVAGARGLD